MLVFAVFALFAVYNTIQTMEIFIPDFRILLQLFLLFLRIIVVHGY